jgi:hypothetical protein
MQAPNQITRTLFAYLSTVAGLPTTYYVDSTAAPTDDHLRAYILPADSFSEGIAFDAATQQSGILQINIFVKAGAGANIQSGDYAQLLLDAFIRGTELSGIEFNRIPQIRNAVADNGFLMASFSAEYTIIG